MSPPVTFEDDDAPLGGPPPDPSQRQWRHPSEIAAAAAAAARPQGPPRARGLSAVSVLVGGTVGLATFALAYAILATATNGASGRLPLPPGTGQAANQEFADLAPTSTIGSAQQVRGPSSTSVDASTSAPALAPSTVRAVSAPLQERPPLAPHLRSIAETALVAVNLGGESVPVVSGLLLDGVVMTSASALGNQSKLTITYRNNNYDAELVGSDPFSDLAVLIPAGLVLQDLGETPERAWPENSGSNETSDRTFEGISVTLLATDGRPVPIAVPGTLLSTDQEATTQSGHTVFGAFETSARLPASGAGGVLVTDQGEAIGLVIDSGGHLAIAIPLTTVRKVAASLMSSGWAGEVWMGIEGSDTARGVLLTKVDDGSPALEAGLERGDVISGLNDSVVKDMATLVSLLRRLSPGDQARLWVQRDGAVTTVTVFVADYPAGDRMDDDTIEKAISEPIGG